jgi:hypothetical protein
VIIPVWPGEFTAMENQMAYLDVSPLMVSLRTSPEEFDFKGGWLRHTPSRHNFKFQPSGRVEIRAECNCAFLAIHPEQEQALARTFHNWQESYWRPLQISREFASHFRPRSALRRALISLTAKLNRWLIGGHDADYPAGLTAE